MLYAKTTLSQVKKSKGGQGKVKASDVLSLFRTHMSIIWGQTHNQKKSQKTDPKV